MKNTSDGVFCLAAMLVCVVVIASLHMTSVFEFFFLPPVRLIALVIRNPGLESLPLKMAPPTVGFCV